MIRVTAYRASGKTGDFAKRKCDWKMKMLVVIVLAAFSAAMPMRGEAVSLSGCVVDVSFIRAQVAVGMLYRGDEQVGTVEVMFGKNRRGATEVYASVAAVMGEGVDEQRSKRSRWAISNAGDGYVISGWFAFAAPIGDMFCSVYADGTLALGNASYEMRKPHVEVACAETIGDYQWTYYINGDTAEILNMGEAAISPTPTGAVTIPSTLGGRLVTRIGYSAFRSCVGLQSVTIPYGVTSIGASAFHGCDGLQSILVEEGNTSYKSVSGLLLTKDGKNIVAVPEGLTRVDIPDGVTSIGGDAFLHYGDVFMHHENITNVNIPYGVADIGDSAFEGCSGLTSVIIPASVTNIGSGAFKDCEELASITLPTRFEGGLDYEDVFDGCHEGLVVTYNDTMALPDMEVVTTNIVEMVVTNTVTVTNFVEVAVVVTNLVEIAADAAVVPESVRLVEPEADFTGADKAKMNGIVFDADGTMRGIIQIETAKATAKGVKVKGFAMLEDGKKVALKAVTAMPENGRLAVGTDAGKLGRLNVTVGGDRFKGALGAMKVVSADIGEDAGVLSGSLTLKYIDAKGKVVNRKIAVGGVATGGTAAGTATPKGGQAKVFAAELE